MLYAPRVIVFLQLLLVSPAVCAETPWADAESIRKLITQLGSDDFDARDSATTALRPFSITNEKILKDAFEKSSDKEVRSRLAVLMAGPLIEGKPIRAWIMLLKSGSFEQASNAVIKLNSAKEDSLPILIDALQDNCPLVRYAALSALPKFGAQAIPAVKVIKELLDKEHPADPAAHEIPIFIHMKSTSYSAEFFLESRTGSPARDPMHLRLKLKELMNSPKSTCVMCSYDESDAINPNIGIQPVLDLLLLFRLAEVKSFAISSELEIKVLQYGIAQIEK